MVYDDIVIGSGLSALATVIGLSPAKRVLVIGGPKVGTFQHYESAVSAPSAYLGQGGLGNFWHGVIPVRDAAHSSLFDVASFEALFRYFYPLTNISGQIGESQLFVPRKPIRPAAEWVRLCINRGQNLVICEDFVTDISVSEATATISTQSSKVTSSRIWLCAGVLHTPALLAKIFGSNIVRQTVSDHVIAYLGQLDRKSHSHISPPKVIRVAGGMWYPVDYGDSGTSLISRKPARFAYKTVDYAIEERAVFGLPTANAVSKIMRKFSPGLVAEAFFNRYGLFPESQIQSVYGQILVQEAHEFNFRTGGIKTNVDAVRTAISKVHEEDAMPELRHSLRRDLFIPGVHLHNSLDPSVADILEMNGSESVVQVADASYYAHLGPEHHSFKIMAAAMQRASRT